MITYPSDLLANLPLKLSMHQQNNLHTQQPTSQAYQQQRIFDPFTSTQHYDERQAQPINSICSPIEEEPRWKQSIMSKVSTAKSNTSNSSVHHIHNQYKILSKRNPRLSNCVRAITQQIQNQILNPLQGSLLPNSSTKNLLPNVPFQFVANKHAQQVLCHKANDSAPIHKQKESCDQIHPDKDVIKQSCFRSLLKATQIDNDAPSDDQDMNLGIRYMYGELLYSVGNQIVSQREDQKLEKTKPIAKKVKKTGHDKENIDTSNLTARHQIKGNAKAQNINQNKKSGTLRTNVSHQNLRMQH